MCDVWQQSNFLSFIYGKKINCNAIAFVFSTSLRSFLSPFLTVSHRFSLFLYTSTPNTHTHTKNAILFSLFDFSCCFLYALLYPISLFACSFFLSLVFTSELLLLLLLYMPNALNRSLGPNQQWRRPRRRRWWRQWSSNNITNLPNCTFILTRIRTHTDMVVSRSSWFLVQPLLQYAHIVLSFFFVKYKYISYLYVITVQLPLASSK